VEFELDLICLTLEGVVVAALVVDAPVCWGLRGCETDEVIRTGDFLVVDALGVGVFTGVEVGFRTGGDFAVDDEDLGVFTGSEAGGDGGGSGTGSLAAGLAEGAAASMTSSGVVWDGDGRQVVEGENEIFGFSSWPVDFGGHSLFSLISSLTESPVICDATLVLRGNGGGIAVSDCRFCSNRPMRFATLCRGRSSGKGLRTQNAN
jgi:hypothetical protein